MLEAPVKRWTAARKAELLAELDRLSPDDQAALLTQHEITSEEVATWRRRHQAFGAPGLSQTRIQELRT